MISTFLALAAQALGLGTSPLVEAAHRHDWNQITDNAEGQAWHDVNWNETFEQDGNQLTLILLRLNSTIPGELMKVDMVMAVDCSAQELGIKEVYLHTSNFGNEMVAPIENLTMDFADTPPSEDDVNVIEAACGEAAAQ